MPAIAILILFFLLSCSGGKNNTDKKTFPGKYGRVDLYSYDSAHYYNDDYSKVQAAYGGDRMIDTSGNLPKRFFEMTTLNSRQSATLKTFLKEYPCAGDIDATTCLPIFRDALIFYDEQGKYMSQVQICFSCGKARFYGNKGFDMCDFDNRTDWESFERFIHSIKSHQTL